MIAWKMTVLLGFEHSSLCAPYPVASLPVINPFALSQFSSLGTCMVSLSWNPLLVIISLFLGAWNSRLPQGLGPL